MQLQKNLPELPDFLQKIKEIGYKIKLDTNGTNSQMIINLIETKMVDYIAMDIKSSLEKYDLVTGVQPDLAEIKKSIVLLEGAWLKRVVRQTQPHPFAQNDAVLFSPGFRFKTSSNPFHAKGRHALWRIGQSHRVF